MSCYNYQDRILLEVGGITDVGGTLGVLVWIDCDLMSWNVVAGFCNELLVVDDCLGTALLELVLVDIDGCESGALAFAVWRC